jgi:hypothetical protein
MYCDFTTSAVTEIPPEDVMVEDAHPQQPPTTSLPPQQQPKNNPPIEPGGNQKQIAQTNPPFKKHQWSDPPDNYQEKMEKWTCSGFHGPGKKLAPGRNSHYG